MTDGDAFRVLPSDWREQVRRHGKAGFTRQEMIRLGFWTVERERPPAATRPNPEASERVARLRAERSERADALAALERRLADIDARLVSARSVEAAIAEARRIRIKRVKAARAERMARRAAERADRRERDRAWRSETLPFLGRGVSGGLRYEGGDPARVAGLGLPWFATPSELAAAMGIATGELAWLTYHRKASAVDHYVRFTIPKKGGGLRTLSAPKTRMRAAQRWLLDAIVARIEPAPAALAFRPGTSTVLNARVHAGGAVVVRLDIEDFFPSITFRRVKGLFESFGYNEGIASIFALLATEAPRVAVTLDGQTRHVALGERRLPQGACTSPALTNVLCRRLDRRLTGIARLLGFAYTRYADDMIFSSPDPDAPVGRLLHGARRVIDEEGFRVHETKTRVMRRGGRQAVTGIVVNGGTPRLARRDLRRFRAFLHGCATRGLAAMGERIGGDARAYARGYLAYVRMVNPAQAERIVRDHPWLAGRAA